MARFYSAVVGLELLKREPDRVWLAAGSRARLGLWSPGAKEFGDGGGRHTHVALSAAPGRLDALADLLRATDVEVRGPVEHRGGDRSIYFEDPAGNVVEAWDFFAGGARRWHDPGASQGGCARVAPAHAVARLDLPVDHVDQDERGNAERRALFVGLRPATLYLVGNSLERQ